MTPHPPVAFFLQAETPLRSEWLRLVSKTLTDGLVYTAIVLQALGAEVRIVVLRKGSSFPALFFPQRCLSASAGALI